MVGVDCLCGAGSGALTDSKPGVTGECFSLGEERVALGGEVCEFEPSVELHPSERAESFAVGDEKDEVGFHLVES